MELCEVNGSKVGVEGAIVRPFPHYLPPYFVLKVLTQYRIEFLKNLRKLVVNKMILSTILCNSLL